MSGLKKTDFHLYLVVISFLLTRFTLAVAEEESDKIRLGHPQLTSGVILVANSNLSDPNFSRTVVLITEYNRFGTVGLILNRPTSTPAKQYLPGLEQLPHDAGNILFGGPVRLNLVRLLVRTNEKLNEQKQVIENIYVIDKDNVLNEILEGEIKITDARVYNGISSWQSGQLEKELIRGDWYLWHADISYIFTTGPGDLWPKLIELVTAQFAKNHHLTIRYSTNL